MSSSNIASLGTGGSGAAYRAYIYVSTTTIFVIETSRGGTAVRGGSYITYYGSAATPFSVKENGVEVFKLTGGGGATVDAVSAFGGTAGSLDTNNLNVFQEIVNVNGVSGASGVIPNQGKFDLNGVPGPVDGHTWGSSGYSARGWSGGSVGVSYHGYCKLSYLGPTPPGDPSYGQFPAITTYIKY